jgi:hypothetical protein
MLARDYADGPRPISDRLWESEAAFNLISPVFLIFFVAGLMAWALARLLREVIFQAAHFLRTRIA